MIQEHPQVVIEEQSFRLCPSQIRAWQTRRDDAPLDGEEAPRKRRSSLREGQRETRREQARLRRPSRGRPLTRNTSTAVRRGSSRRNLAVLLRTAPRRCRSPRKQRDRPASSGHVSTDEDEGVVFYPQDGQLHNSYKLSHQIVFLLLIQ
jgi:hypothetical protein